MPTPSISVKHNPSTKYSPHIKGNLCPSSEPGLIFYTREICTQASFIKWQKASLKKSVHGTISVRWTCARAHSYFAYIYRDGKGK